MRFSGSRSATDTVSLTYDALGRVVEQKRGSSYTEIVYTPGGGKLALMNGQTLQQAFCALPGGGTAVYNSGGLAYYRHSDWLGSSRLATTTGSPTSVYADLEYAPFGEVYGGTGNPDYNFTGQNQDTISNSNAGLYDFLFREYSPVQGRWISPDPAGMAAVSIAGPQSWNRYAYVANGPLNSIDALGLFRDRMELFGMFDNSCSINGAAANCGMVADFAAAGGEFGLLCFGNCNSFNSGALRIGANGGDDIIVTPNGHPLVIDDHLVYASDLRLEGTLGGGGDGPVMSLRLFGGPARCDSQHVNDAKLNFENAPSGVSNVKVDARGSGKVTTATAGANMSLTGSLRNPYPGTNTPPASGLHIWIFGYYASGAGSVQWTVNYKLDGKKQTPLTKTFEVTCQSTK